MPSADLLDQVNAYYTSKVKEHGPTPRGVDWNSSQSQEIRFAQLLRVVDWSNPVVLGDYGCGYGALWDYLHAHGKVCGYRGYDISEAMLAEARHRRPNESSVVFGSTEQVLNESDYIVASGIFNVRLKTSVADWKSYVFDTLDRLARPAKRGFAFNCLTSYSDADRMRDDLFYADPCEIFAYCKRRFSRNVALLHDYDLYEFTMLVRK